MPTPTTISFQQTIADFYSKWNYPNVCGAIDGKHVRIRCPSNAGSAFFKHKDVHSIVLLAIVDAHYKFIALDVGSYGREGEAGIFLKSEMGKLINSGNFNIPPSAALPSTNIVLPNVILGDEAFALTDSMMKPYPRGQSLRDVTKAIYNYRHSRARRTTENCFGIMSAYFRIFFTPIHTTPEKIDKIILASCVLHNMMRDEKIPSQAESAFGNTDKKKSEIE
ncbi:putative nuclease HARBI1 [Sitodiplosis mosellana]|uniref:putative nuclease HARBI1 n=1 Tax=Sitodiplosis mosellana TaxID=263140 RepID=UPI00244515DC|nr:putative nuclease HARBI1 [Sitodiplosis mosellana]